MRKRSLSGRLPNEHSLCSLMLRAMTLAIQPSGASGSLDELKWPKDCLLTAIVIVRPFGIFGTARSLQETNGGLLGKSASVGSLLP
jgi:hypothetical protein